MLLRGLIGAMLVAGFASDALAAEADTSAATPNRPRPTASAPT